MVELHELLVNTSDHDIDIVVDDGTITIPQSGYKLRLVENFLDEHTVHGLPAVRKSYQLPDLPAPRWIIDQQCSCELLQVQCQPGEGVTCQCGRSSKLPVFFIVSLPLFQAISAAEPGRRDFVCPDTGPSSAIRDSSGRIKAVRRLMSM